MLPMGSTRCSPAMPKQEALLVSCWTLLFTIFSLEVMCGQFVKWKYRYTRAQRTNIGKYSLHQPMLINIL